LDKPVERAKNRKLPDVVEESNSIGADAGDATSGVPKSPEDWAEEQPVEEAPTYPLDAGDPSPVQPVAGSPDAERSSQPPPGKRKAPQAP
jgi:hypothetical protein